MTPPMGDVAIQVSGLRKSYGRTEAVRGIDLQVLKGEVFALFPRFAGFSANTLMFCTSRE